MTTIKKIRIVIPMPSDAEVGPYYIGVKGQDLSNIQIGPSDYDDFIYTLPNAPDVPKTGQFYETLNIAKTDYIVTGLLIFFATAIGALFLINRKKEG